jgi:hypothetical protein
VGHAGRPVVFVALGIVFLVAHSTVKMTVAGALAVPFFGFCSLLIAWRLLRDRPELMLDDAGVDHGTLGRFGWDEIAAVGSASSGCAAPRSGSSSWCCTTRTRIWPEHPSSSAAPRP